MNTLGGGRPCLGPRSRDIRCHTQTPTADVTAVAKTQKRLRENPEAGVKVAQKIFPALDVELIRNIIVLQRPSYIPTITEDAIRTANQFQKQAGVVKADFPYDKIVAVQFKALWEQ
jgi:ABC-type nitrate/sulfonate/bicarbonate transport system substrate-binding protein